MVYVPVAVGVKEYHQPPALANGLPACEVSQVVSGSVALVVKVATFTVWLNGSEAGATTEAPAHSSLAGAAPPVRVSQYRLPTLPAAHGKPVNWLLFVVTRAT